MRLEDRDCLLGVRSDQNEVRCNARARNHREQRVLASDGRRQDALGVRSVLIPEARDDRRQRGVRDADNVLWVYVDIQARRPEHVDVALVSASSWALLDPLYFVRDLYRASIRFEDPEDRDAVAVLG